MNYLIAGGAGFIGINLIKKLLENENNYITCVDNLSTSIEKNIEQFYNHKNFIAFLKKDICDWDIKHDAQWDRIINLACPASPVHYQRDGLGTILTNVVGTNKMLSQAYFSKARFLQASTSEIYGDPTVHPQHEDYFGNVNCYGPRSCYDEGKRCAEALVWEYHKIHTDTRIIRIFNTYGPYMAADDGRVVSNFIVAALKGENLVINGDGKQTRSFCYVDDLVDGLVAVLEGKFPHPLNLGNPGEFNVNTLASMILVLTNSNSKVIYRPALQDDPKQRRPDITDVKYLVGWEPKISLTDGLKKTIEYFEKELSRGN